MRRISGLYCLLFVTKLMFSHQGLGSSPSEKQSMVRFTENKSQWEKQVLYRAQLDGGSIWLEKNKLIYSFYDKDTYRNIHGNPKNKVPSAIKAAGFHVELINANPAVKVSAKNPYPDYANYFIGKDPSKWASNTRIFHELNYEEVWNGVRMQIIGKENSVKYNFYVTPNASTEQIKLFYYGLENIRIKNGELILETGLGEIKEGKPYAYQIINGKEVVVPCNYLLNKKTIGFDFPKGYDKNYELIIDPVLVFACSSGSTADNFGMTATYDDEGHLYSGGICFDQGFPVVNPYDGTYNSLVQYGQMDIVITKYDSTGAFLRYSTYIGGAMDAEVVNSLITDAQGNLYFYGVTASADFPTTGGAYDQTFNGGKRVRFYYNGAFFEHGTDIVIGKLSAGGNVLMGATYLGGSRNDGLNYSRDSTFVGNVLPYGAVYQPSYDTLMYNYGDNNRGEIMLDAANNIYIAASTHSSDFPIINGFDNTLGGFQDAIVAKLDNSLSTLIWSTYLGGNKNDAGYGIAVDAANNVFVTGGTSSSGLGTTNAYQATYIGGKADAYIAKINPNGNVLTHFTYFGTTLYDQSYFVQLDNNSNVYIFGQNQGPLTVINATYSSPNGRQFIAKFDSTLSTLAYRTVFGNGTSNINLSPSAFLVDCTENIYLSGWGGNILSGVPMNNMPLTTNAYQPTTDGFNFYLMVIQKNAQSLLYATYFGGAQSHEHVDGGTSRFDKKGIVYQSVCAGCGGFDDFPVTPGAWPTSVYGSNINQSTNCNNGTFKFNFEYTQPVAIAATNTNSGCAPLTVQFTNSSLSYNVFLWDFGNNDTTSLIQNPTHTFTSPGTYTVTLLVESNICAVGMDTTRTIITVHPSPTAGITANLQPCSNTVNFTNTSTGNPTSYNWNFGNGQNSTSASPPPVTYTPGTYTVILNATSNPGNCSDTAALVVTTNIIPVTSDGDTAFCPGGTAQLNASGGGTYSWAPATGLSNTSAPNPTASPSSSTNYTVTVTQTDPLGNSCPTAQTVSVTVNPQVNANFTQSSNQCGNTFSFTDGSTGGANNWLWNFGDGFTSTQQNPLHSYMNPGTYTVTLIANNTFGCPDTIQGIVSIANFTPIFVTPASTICNGNSVQLTASGGISYTWTPSSGLSATNIPNPVASPTATTNYSVTILQVNSLGDTCISTLQTTVTVPAFTPTQLQAAANPTMITSGQSSQITTSYPGTGTILWTPPYMLSDSSSFNPVATPLHTTTYTGVITDPWGCQFPLAPVTIYVITDKCDESVYVPNAFTPNNDGNNDVLYVRSNHLTKIYFAVYNRWGQLVFETEDISKGWDGTYNGMKADPGVFGYYLRYSCDNSKNGFKKGNVTLIR